MPVYTWKLKDEDSCGGCPLLLEYFEYNLGHHDVYNCPIVTGYREILKRPEQCKKELGK